jgi:hypothetical protein
MQDEGIFLKKIDKQAYRKLKAVAAERGVPVYRLINEAMLSFIKAAAGELKAEDGNSLITVETMDNIAFRRAETDPSLIGKWIGLANGSLIAEGRTQKEVAHQMSKKYKERPFSHGIIGKVGQKSEEEREWLAGSLQRA